MKTIIVLGMHRSATSLVAKSLNSEIYMGNNLLEANIHNPEGYFENSKFVELNDKILGSAGGSWDSPPSRKDILAVGFRFKSEIKKLIESEGEGKDIWGWKDPRSVLTIELFLPFIEGPHFVACFREPEEVARSLERRGDVGYEQGLRLTKEYNNRMLKFLSDYYSGKLKVRERKLNPRGVYLLGKNKLKRNIKD